MEAILRAYEATIEDVSPVERMVVAKINTGSVDRYRSVIDPMGIDLKQYRENPVVLWEHGKDPLRGSLPIGRNVGIKAYRQMNGSIVARTQFGKDEYSQSLFEMYRDGLLRGWSVNVLPDHKRCSPPTKEEKRSRPELEDCDIMYRGSTLAEYSGVSVPGNAEALSIMEARGIWFPSEARAENPKPLPGTTTCTMDDGDDDDPDGDEDDIGRRIKRDGDEWAACDESGKVLGKHKSKDAARAQLVALEAHKHDPARSSGDGGKTYEEIVSQVFGDRRAFEARLVKTITELMDLARGRV